MRLKYIGPGNYFQVSGRELPVHEMYHLAFLLVLLVSSQARKRSRARRRRISFDFNCQSKCGKYNKEDRWGRNLQKGCTAMEKSDKCQQKFVIKKTNKEEKRNWRSYCRLPPPYCPDPDPQKRQSSRISIFGVSPHLLISRFPGSFTEPFQESCEISVGA